MLFSIIPGGPVFPLDLLLRLAGVVAVAGGLAGLVNLGIHLLDRSSR
jgi:hypothetical protein